MQSPPYWDGDLCGREQVKEDLQAASIELDAALAAQKSAHASSNASSLETQASSAANVLAGPLAAAGSNAQPSEPAGPLSQESAPRRPISGGGLQLMLASAIACLYLQLQF